MPLEKFNKKKMEAINNKPTVNAMNVLYFALYK